MGARGSEAGLDSRGDAGRGSAASDRGGREGSGGGGGGGGGGAPPRVRTDVGKERNAGDESGSSGRMAGKDSPASPTGGAASSGRSEVTRSVWTPAACVWAG